MEDGRLYSGSHTVYKGARHHVKESMASGVRKCVPYGENGEDAVYHWEWEGAFLHGEEGITSEVEEQLCTLQAHLGDRKL